MSKMPLRDWGYYGMLTFRQRAHDKEVCVILRQEWDKALLFYSPHVFVSVFLLTTFGDKDGWI